jgi:hypothetical protein
MLVVLLIILYCVVLGAATSVITYWVIKKYRKPWRGREVPEIPRYEERYENIEEFRIHKSDLNTFPAEQLRKIHQIISKDFTQVDHNVLYVPKELLYHLFDFQGYKFHPQWDLPHHHEYADIVIHNKYFIKGTIDQKAVYPRATLAPINNDLESTRKVLGMDL